MLALGFVLRLYPLLLRTNALVRHVADDGYMYFKLAQNIVGGKGISFDGVAKTNGFHPLYAFLIVPIFYAFRGLRDAPVKASVVLLALFDVATGAVIYATVSTLFGHHPGLFAAFVWLVNPCVFQTCVQGLEAPVWVFF